MHTIGSAGADADKWAGLRRAGIRLVASILMAAFTGSALAQVPGKDVQAPDVSLNPAVKAEVIRSLSRALRDQYVFPGVGDELAKTLEHQNEDGDYDSVTSAREFSRLLTAHMGTIAHDAHLRVFYVYRMPPPAERGRGSTPSSRVVVRKMEEDNFGFDEVQRLDGNVGYLKVTGFADPERAGPTVAAAMTLLSYTNALIIDLRRNHGGSPGMVDLLASYFLPSVPPVHLNDLSWRKRGTTQHILQQFWTLPYVPGERYLNKEVFILVSHETPSAAEEFTYDLQTLKRVVVVGEPTWGGANPGGVVPLASHFLAFIPSGEAINPTTKTNWEGKGVQPEVKAPAKDAFGIAYKMVLQHLIAATKDAAAQSRLRHALAAIDSDGHLPACIR